MNQQSEDNSFHFKTAAEAKFTEDKLRAEGISFKTSIVKTRRRGLEYLITILESAA